MRALSTLLVATLATAECQRMPAENFAASSATAEPSDTAEPAHSVAAFTPAPPATPRGAGVDGARCVVATPDAPPLPVPAGPDSRCPADPDEGRIAALATARVVFPDAAGVSVEAEITRTRAESERGLMYRKSLAEDRGMLFDLRERGRHAFWMHNTCIPLDMLFVDEDGLIVGIVENAPTLDDGTREVSCPSRWVLEVNAGWSRRHGVRAGQRLILPR